MNDMTQSFVFSVTKPPHEIYPSFFFKSLEGSPQENDIEQCQYKYSNGIEEMY